MNQFASGTKVLWTSNTKRVRKARVVTHLMCAPHACIVEVTQGLPGEVGGYCVVPPGRLTPESD